MRGNQFRVLGSISSLFAVGSVAAVAHATSVSGARLTAVEITGTNVAVLTTDTVAGGRPQCHYPLAETQYSFDVSTSKGRAMLQVAQAALLANKKIYINGGTACLGAIESATSLRIYAQ